MNEHLNNALPLRQMSGRRSKPSIDLLVDSQRILSPYNVAKTVKVVKITTSPNIIRRNIQTQADNISISNHSESSFITAKRKPGPKCQRSRQILTTNVQKKCPPVSPIKYDIHIAKVNGEKKIIEDRKSVIDQPTIFSQAPYATLKLKKIDFIETLGLTKKVSDSDEEIEKESIRTEVEKDRCMSEKDKKAIEIIKVDKLRRDIKNAKKLIAGITKDSKKVILKKRIKMKSITKETENGETTKDEDMTEENTQGRDEATINEGDIAFENKEEKSTLKNGEKEIVIKKHKKAIIDPEDGIVNNVKNKDKEYSTKIIRQESNYTKVVPITCDKKMVEETASNTIDDDDDDDDLPLSKAFPDFRPQSAAPKAEIISVLTPKKKKIKSDGTVELNGDAEERRWSKCDLSSVGRIVKKRPLNGVRQQSQTASQSSPKKAADDLSVPTGAVRNRESEGPASHHGGAPRETPRRCVRATCTNVAIEDCRWDSEFCSPDCAVLHGKSLISEWIFQRRESASNVRI